jgi:hypothetical protein
MTRILSQITALERRIPSFIIPPYYKGGLRGVMNA